MAFNVPLAVFANARVVMKVHMRRMQAHMRRIGVSEYSLASLVFGVLFATQAAVLEDTICNMTITLLHTPAGNRRASQCPVVARILRGRIFVSPWVSVTQNSKHAWWTHRIMVKRVNALSNSPSFARGSVMRPSKLAASRILRHTAFK